MEIKFKNKEFELEQFNGISTRLISKENGFSFCSQPMFVCDCGNPGYFH